MIINSSWTIVIILQKLNFEWLTLFIDLIYLEIFPFKYKNYILALISFD